MPELKIHPNAPSVVSEVIDGEAVIMNLATGHYFSTLGSGCELWALITAGATEESLATHLRERYSVSHAESESATSGFLSRLREHDLVTESAGNGVHSNRATVVWEAPAGPYEAPVLNAYSDMEELLLLDPIHDVSEAGWPMPKPADT